MEEKRREHEKKLFLKFQQELMKWYRTGARPSSSDENAAGLMELQSRRLRENGLEMEAGLKGGKEVFLEIVTVSAEAHREESTYSRQIKKKTLIKKDNKKLYSRKEKITMIQDMIFREDDTDRINGKIHDFGWKKEEDDVSRFIDRYKKITVSVVAVLELLAAFFISMAAGEFSLYIIFGGFVFAAFPIAPFVLIGYFIMHSVALGMRKKKAALKKADNILTREEADRKLSECDFRLTFQYIEKKAADIVKVFLLGGVYGNSSICQDGSQGEEFKNILEVRYTGETELCLVSKHDGGIWISLNIMCNNLRYTGKKVEETRDKIHMEMHRGENDDENNWIVTSIEPCR